MRGPSSDSSHPGGRTIAITRAVSNAIGACELTHLERSPIDVARAQAQHAAYVRALSALGCEVVELESLAEHPDAVFVEDTALVLDEVAVMTRPGAESRRGELASIELALAPHRRCLRIEAPGTLDGGDVVVLGRRVLVGRSSRSNDAGIDALRHALAPYDYAVEGVDVRGCLHLKSAACALDERTVVINPAWIDASTLGAERVIETDPGEPEAANVVPVLGRVLHAKSFPRTRARIVAMGFDVMPVEAGELAKAEGALTCCSLIFRAGSGSEPGRPAASG